VDLEVPGYKTLKFIFGNWKLIIHLLFGTFRFGVDNKWRSSFDSMFSVPWNKRYKLIERYKLMRFRAEIGFISQHDFVDLFPIYCWQRGIKKVKYEE
jgi:hypothetical protein